MFWPIVRIFVLLLVLKLSSLKYPFIDTYYFKNSCFGFHQVSKREKTFETNDEAAGWVVSFGFRAFGNLIKFEAWVFQITSPTKKNALLPTEKANKAEITILSARYTTRPGLQLGAAYSFREKAADHQTLNNFDRLVYGGIMNSRTISGNVAINWKTRRIG